MTSSEGRNLSFSVTGMKRLSWSLSFTTMGWSMLSLSATDVIGECADASKATEDRTIMSTNSRTRGFGRSDIPPKRKSVLSDINPFTTEHGFSSVSVS